MHEDERRADPDGSYDEQKAPRDVIHDHAGEHDPKTAADPEHRRHQPDRDSDLLARKLVADDPVAEGEHGGTGALNRAPADQRPDVPGGGRADGADEEERE